MKVPRFTNLALDVADLPEGGTEAVLRGELDLEDADAVDAALAEVQRLSAALVLDLRELTFVDSSGTRAVWSAHLRAREAGGALTVLVGPGAVRRALAVTGLDRELNLVEDDTAGNGSA